MGLGAVWSPAHLMFGLDLQKRQLCSSGPAAGQANKTFLLAIVKTQNMWDFLIQTKPEKNKSNKKKTKELTDKLKCFLQYCFCSVGI